MTVVRRALATVIALSMGAAAPTAGQAIPRLTVDSAYLSADTVGIGDSFELTLSISLAPASVLFIPDSLYAPSFQPLGPAEWTVDREASRVSVTYPLIAFEVGALEVPEFEVYAAAREEGVAAGMAATGDWVGDFEAFIDGVAEVPSARLRAVPPQQLWVASVLLVEDVAVGLRPRPPADVAGADVHVLALLLGLLSLGVFVWAAWSPLRAWNEARLAAAAAVSARDRALRDLEALRTSGVHHDGRLQDFFTRSSAIVRRYVETLDRRWSPAWTSTELMGGLDDSLGDESAGVSTEMAEAEVVKFGGLRPDTDTAEAHVQALKRWIESRPVQAPTAGGPEGDE